MTTQLIHPYANCGGTWVRGSFHGHCSESSHCAGVPLADSVRWYSDAGVDFVTLTDHDVVTDLSEVRALYPDVVLLEGFEYSTCENLVFVGDQVEPLYELPLGEALKRCGSDCLTMVCHPMPYAAGPEYWTLAKLEELGSWPDGIEVYNGHYGIPRARANGRQPLGTGLWDEVLSAGHCLWGYANDDMHDPDDLGNAWNMVQVERPTAAAIVGAARAGRCYATTGLLLGDFSVEAGTIRVELAGAAQGRFVGPGGLVLVEGSGNSHQYEVRDEAYVRFEAQGEAGRIFLQPVRRGQG